MVAFSKSVESYPSNDMRADLQVTTEGLKKKWDSQCQEAFDKIKGYLANPPILTAPAPSKKSTPLTHKSYPHPTLLYYSLACAPLLMRGLPPRMEVPPPHVAYRLASIMD